MRSATPVSLCFALPLLLFVGCGQEAAPTTEEPEAVSFEEALLGTWEMIELEVEAPTYAGSDTTFQQHIQEADWVRIYGVNPGRTTFSADGKLVRRNRLVGNETPVVTHGLWRYQQDSLMIIEPNTTHYFLPQLSAAQDQLEVQGQIDWDSDGERDDVYRARYRLVGKTQEAEG